MGNAHQPEHDRRLAETCPVCGKLFLPAVIASHVSDHLQTGTIVVTISGNTSVLSIDGHRIRTTTTS